MAKLKSPKRQIAYKVWLSDIINSNFVKKEGWDPSYIEFEDKQISRVNIIATIVGKFVSEDGNYAAITLDDGTETIRVKAFGPDVSKVLNVNISNIVRFIGKVKKYEDEIYLSPEVVREVDDPNWVIVRKLEIKEPKEVVKKEKVEKVSEEKEEIKEEKIGILKEEPKEEDTSEPKEQPIEKKEEPVIEEPKEEVEDNADFLQIIKKLDKGEGAEMEKVIEESGLDKEEAKNFLFGLLKRGEIFEPKKGKLKVLD